MKPFNRVNEADLAFFESILPGRVFSGVAISTDYDHDEMTIYGHYAPEAVLQAQSTEEISAVLRYCNGRNIAVTPRGAGTGLCGGCVATEGGVVLSTERMKRVLEVDTRNMTATVEPGVLLFDEPLSNLDAKLRVSMRTEIRRIQQATGITAIYVTHDQSEAMALSDSIIIMNKGVVAQIGSPQEIYYHPNSEFVADFIGEANFLKGKCVALEDGCGVLQLADTQVRVAATENMAVGEDYTIVLRPESAGLVPEGNLKCRVVLSCFMGAYQNYHVMVGDTLVKLTDYNPKNHRIYQVGETCALTFEPDGVHVL